MTCCHEHFDDWIRVVRHRMAAGAGNGPSDGRSVLDMGAKTYKGHPRSNCDFEGGNKDDSPGLAPPYSRIAHPFILCKRAAFHGHFRGMQRKLDLQTASRLGSANTTTTNSSDPCCG